MCVRACPARVRHFGDFADPDSPVSRLAAERRAVALLAALGYRPARLYLPPRTRGDGETAPLAPAPGALEDWLDGFHRP